MNQSAKIITLENEKLKLKIMTFGAILLSLEVKMGENKHYDVVLGHDNLENYLRYSDTYFGAIIGRNANRIKDARLTIENQEYQLEANERTSNLHSGDNGFHNQYWSIAEYEPDHLVTLSYLSEDGEQGFPGNLKTSVTYEINDTTLRIKIDGVSDQTTIFNPTSHSYFNLNGHASGSIENHYVSLKALSYQPVDQALIPTGHVESVMGTPFDLFEGRQLKTSLQQPHDQLEIANGFDHNFVIDHHYCGNRPFAEIIGDQTGIRLEMFTNLPGVQFYTGNGIPEMTGKNNAHYSHRSGFCLETQYFPNAVNEVKFMSPLIKAHQKETYETLYHFTWK